MRDTTKALIAEFLGTFALIFIGAGAVCTSAFGGGAGLLGVALAHGTVLAVMVSSLGHISGAHFNPAVTIALLTAQRFDSRNVLPYIAAQMAGAVLAAYLLSLVIPEDTWRQAQLGAAQLAQGITVVQATTLEAILTFFLVIAVFGTAVDPKGSWQIVAGFGIGTVLIFDILVGGPWTGAAMNPARAFGPALVSGTWANHAVYWIGPILGGVLAGALYGVFLGGRR